MQAWATLLDLVVLLGAALVMGILAERLKQSAIVGYILSGMLVGPNVLGWVGTNEEVKILAEIGAALLLFSIGLEFSFRHLRQLGGPTLLAGIFQISLTTLSVFAIGVVFGMNLKSAVTLGVIIALSSTACVIRVLKEKSQLDSGFGRTAIGILLLQDIAVVPAIILVTTLGQDTDALEAVYSLARVLGFGLLLVGVLYVVFNRLVPRVLQFRSISKNRDLPILLATVAAIGSAIAAHSLGITPAFGAFLAGVLLAESPFSRQIRADLGALRTLLITLFFAAIGMYGDPGWTLNNLPV
ncbi:MAG: cation:proton antiporter, partial [Phycisphaerae bacterium]|nr:cation:proton antiporter [Phycisphaerae bacterium]